MKRYILTLIICTILSLTSVKATTKVVFNETSNGNINTTLGFDTGFVGGIDITLKLKGNVSYENFNLNNISNAKYSNVTYNKKDNTINIILLTGGVGTSHNLLDKNKNLNLGNLIVNANAKNDISYSLECTSLTVLDNSWKSSSITPELVDNSLTYKGEKEEENPGSDNKDDNKPNENENNNDTDKDNNNSGNTENNNGNTSENKDNESSSNNGSSSQNNAGTNNNQNSSSNNNSGTSSNARPNNNASGNNGSASNNAGGTNSSSKNNQDKDDDKDKDDEDKDEDDNEKDEENTSKTPSNKPNNNTTITNGNTTSEEEEEKGFSALKIIIPAVGIIALGALSYRFLKRNKKTPNDFDI